MYFKIQSSRSEMVKLWVTVFIRSVPTFVAFVHIFTFSYVCYVYKNSKMLAFPGTSLLVFQGNTLDTKVLLMSIIL